MIYTIAQLYSCVLVGAQNRQDRPSNGGDLARIARHPCAERGHASWQTHRSWRRWHNLGVAENSMTTPAVATFHTSEPVALEDGEKLVVIQEGDELVARRVPAFDSDEPIEGT